MTLGEPNAPEVPPAVPAPPAPRPGLRTTEFWVVAPTVAVAAFEAIRGEAKGPWALVVAGALAGLYALMHTRAKGG